MSMMNDCGVCGVSFDQFQHGPMIVCRQQHVYCEECTTQLLKQNQAKCPECRQNLKKEDAVKFRQYLEWSSQMRNMRAKIKEEQERASACLQTADALKELMGFQFPNEEIFFDYAKQRAEKLFQIGKNHAAIALLMSLIERFPNQDRYQFIGLGSKEQQTGFSERKSLNWYKQRQGVKYLSAEDLLNHFLMQTPSFEGGKSWYEHMILKHPERYKLVYGSALNKHNKKDHKGAIQDYKRTLELNPNFFKAYCMLGFLAKDKEESRKFANQYLIRKSSNIFAQFILASGHQQDSICNLNEILKQQPEYVRALNELGNIYVGKKMYDEAIERYKICTSISQHYYKPVINIGKTYFLSGDKVKAVEYFEQLMDTNLPAEHRSEALYQLATIYKQSKDFKRSIACFKEYLQLDPLQHLPKAGLAQSYAMLQKYQFAIKAYGKITSLANQNTQFFDGIIKCFFQLKKYQQCIRLFEKFRKEDPSNSTISQCLGRIHCQIKDWRKSQQFYLGCLKLGNNSLPIYMKIIENYHSLRQFDSALKYVGQPMINCELTSDQYDILINMANIIKQTRNMVLFRKTFHRSWEQ